MKRSQESKLIFARLFVEDGMQFWGMPDFPVIEQADDDRLHDVVDGDRIDQLAGRYLGKRSLGWVIALANGIEIYPNGINPNTTIRIPSVSRVRDKILPMAQKMRDGR